MNWSSFTAALAIVIVFFCGSFAETPNAKSEPTMIPLDKIWGFNMPGTANAEELDPSGKLFMTIRRALWNLPQQQGEAGPAFAVSGTEAEAISQVHAVLVEGKERQKTFPPNSQIYIAFFSYQNRPYVHLYKVERIGNEFNVHWQFVPHETEETTEHFALIPLGKLPSGRYRVNIVRSPMQQKYIDLGFRPMSDAAARRIVCRSFSFSISEQGK